MRRPIIQHIFFLTLLVLTTLAFLGLIRDFLQPVFWAAVLAIIFHPVQEWWRQQVGGKDAIASVLTIITITFIVLLPLFATGVAVARESITIYNQLVAGEMDLREPIRLIEEQVPIVSAYLERAGIQLDEVRENLSQAAVVSTQYIAQQALSIGQNALRFGVQLFIMLYVLFFFLRDGERLVESMVWALPLGDDRERRLFERFANVSRATIKGGLVIAILQGGLGGFFFWILGIPGPVLFGLVMMILSLLPAVGAALVWGPAAIILIATGDVLSGVILIAAGSLMIGLVDNILRPILVARDTQMPDFIILLATLGGLIIFGISGIVIGPIIAAFFLTVWTMFAEEYAQDDAPDEPFGAPDDGAAEPDEELPGPAEQPEPTEPTSPDVPAEVS